MVPRGLSEHPRARHLTPDDSALVPCGSRLRSRICQDCDLTQCAWGEVGDLDPPNVVATRKSPSALCGAGTCRSLQPWSKAASNDAVGGSKSKRLRNSSASGAPWRRSIAASSHSTEIGPA